MSQSINRSRITVNVLVQLLLLVVIVVLVNYFAFNHYQRWDLSRDGKYALSEQTQRVVGDLKKRANIVVFFAGDSDIANDVATLAREYAAISKKRLSVEVVNPYLNLTRARELATQYKLGDRENVVIIDYEGRSKLVSANEMAEYHVSFVPGEAPRLKAFKGEEALTSALVELSEQGVNVVYAIGGHGESDLNSENHSALKTYIDRQNIRIQPLRLSDVEAVPEDARLLLLIGPKYDFAPRELDLLAAYWKRQGRLLILLDPEAPTPSLSLFLKENGVVVNDDRVLKTLPLGNVTGVLRDVTGDFLPTSPITQRLGNVMASFLGVTQSLTLEPDRVKERNIRLAPLIRASKGYWAETRYEINDENSSIFFDANEDTASPIVAASIEKGALTDQAVQVDSSRLVLVGNAAFIDNQALTDGDLDFILSSINWLLDRDSLIGIAPKAMRNFTLSLSDAQISRLALITMGAIPGAAALLGLIAWFKRRR